MNIELRRREADGVLRMYAIAREGEHTGEPPDGFRLRPLGIEAQ